MGRAKGQRGVCSICQNRAGTNHNKSTCPWRQRRDGEEVLTRKQVLKRGQYQRFKDRQQAAKVESLRGQSHASTTTAGTEDAQPPPPPPTHNVGATNKNHSSGDGTANQPQEPATTSSQEEADVAEVPTNAEERVEADPLAEDDERIPDYQRLWMEDELRKLKDSISLKKGPRGKGGEQCLRIRGVWPHHQTGYWINPPDPNFVRDGTEFNPLSRCLKRLFVWVPEYIHNTVYVNGVLKCPTCKDDKRVISEGFNPHGPRRVYDEDDSFYVICKRYRCQGCRLSFNGYARNVMDLMAPDIADDFPCFITHRSAVSVSLIDKLRNLLTVTPGIGVAGYRRCLESLHLNRYYRSSRAYHSATLRAHLALKNSGFQTRIGGDMIRLLDAVRKPQPFPLFDEGYNGRIPSETYLSMVIQEDLARREKWIDRRGQMVDGLRVIKADGSMKIADKVRVDGKAPLSVLYTVMNQYHQIATSSFLESESAEEIGKLLDKLRRRCELHQFELPELLYIDNCCHLADVFTKHFPSLKANASSAEKSQKPKLKDYPLTLDKVITLDLGHSEIVEAQANKLCGDILQNGEKECGLDIEWCVGVGEGHGKVSLIQLANRKKKTGALTVYLFRVGKLATNVKDNRLPHGLVQILTDGAIAKAGRCVNQDAAKLLEAFGVRVNGAVELTALAAEKGFPEYKKSSLSGLCEAFLGLSLDKSQEVRLSNWEAKVLSEDQQLYAAKDAAASLAVYQRLISEEAPYEAKRPSLADLGPGSKVCLLSKSERTRLGYGEVVEVCTSDALGPRKVHSAFNRELVLNKKRVLLKITAIEVPGSVLPLYQEDPAANLNEVSMAMAMAAGEKVLWPMRALRLARPVNKSTKGRGKLRMRSSGAKDDYSAEFDCEGDKQFRAIYEAAAATDDQDEGESAIDDEDIEGEQSAFADFIDGADIDDADICMTEGCFCSATETTDESSLGKEAWQYIRVKLDSLHAMMRLTRSLSKKHGAFSMFTRRLQDAFFMIHLGDLRDLELKLEKSGLTSDEVKAKMEEDYGYVLRRVRRLIPPPKELHQRLSKLYEIYADIVDHRSRARFFTPAAERQWENLLLHVAKGCISDHPDIPVYLDKEQKDSQGQCVDLRPVSCIRGTSDIEGYHRHIRDLLAATSASPKLAILVLKEYNHRWNLRMAREHRGLDKNIAGFMDQFLIEDIQELASQLFGDDPILHTPFPQWVSTKYYQDTKELFGIQKSFPDIDESSTQQPTAQPFNRSTASSKWVLERMAGNFASRIFTKDDRKAFRKYWDNFVLPGRRRGGARIDFTAFASFWNADLVDDNVTRKTAKHLEDHLRTFMNEENVAATMSALQKGKTKFQENLELKEILRQAQGRAFSSKARDTSSRPSSQSASFDREEVTPLTKTASAKLQESIKWSAAELEALLRLFNIHASTKQNKDTPPQRRSQICSECGHLRAAFVKHHFSKSGSMRCTNTNRRLGWPLQSTQRKRIEYNPCDCKICVAHLTSSSKSPKGLKRRSPSATGDERQPKKAKGGKEKGAGPSSTSGATELDGHEEHSEIPEKAEDIEGDDSSNGNSSQRDEPSPSGEKERDASEGKQAGEPIRTMSSCPADQLLLTTEEKHAVDRVMASMEQSIGVESIIQLVDFKTLAPDTWLCDEVVNKFLRLCQEKAERSLVDAVGNPADQTVVCISSLFFPLLTGDARTDFTFDRVRLWVEMDAIGDFQRPYLIVVPIHSNGNHWTLALIDSGQKHILYYDPLHGSGRQRVAVLKEFMRCYLLSRQEDVNDLETWTLIGDTASDAPRQMNSEDCGVFICMYAYYALFGKTVAGSFRQEDCYKLRYLMALAIMKEDLSPLEPRQ